MMFKWFVVAIIFAVVSSQSCDPPCANGGVCIGPNTCWCKNPGFTGPTCDDIQCLNGGTPKGNGECNCPSGWAGIRCEVCQVDSVCAPKKCARSLLETNNIEKFVTCKVLPPLGKLLGNNLTFQVDIDTTQKEQHGKMYMQVFFPYEPGKLGELFWCNEDDCKVVESGGNVNFECQVSNCRCSKYCSKEVADIIKMAKGWGKIACDSKYKCHFTQKEIPFGVDIECSAGSCQ